MQGMQNTVCYSIIEFPSVSPDMDVIVTFKIAFYPLL